MKIAVLTLSLHANYGGTLQAFALMTALKDLGHEALYLDRERHKTAPLRIPLELCKRAFQKFVLRKGGIGFRWGVLDAKERDEIAKLHRPFISRNIQPRTQEFLTSAQLAKGIGKYGFDAVVVGSDQVWRADYVAANLSDYFCGFLPASDAKTRRVAYAASFGTDEWEFTDSQTDVCRPLAKRFHAISVREDSGVKLCHDHLGVDAEHVIDPTMLLEPSRYLALLPDSRKKYSGILVYLLDESHEKLKVVDAIATQLQLPVVRINKGSQGDPSSSKSAPPIEDWLAGFRDADFVITDSFHGSVFSILFNKPFVAYGNAKRGMARFTSLLKMFGLEDRLVTTSEHLDPAQLAKPMDWTAPNAVLRAQRAKAQQFLQRAFHG